MLNFKQSSMLHLLEVLEPLVQNLQAQEIIEFEVLNPDIIHSVYSGTILNIDNEKYIYRGYKTWTDLAHTLHCRMLTPSLISTNSVSIRYQKLNTDDSFHRSIRDPEEKYGTDSIFSEIHKNEESAFLSNYLQALKNVNINKRFRILNLGINSGDEFEVIQEYSSNFENLELVGIDYCSSAINKAQKKYENISNIKLYSYDINDLNELNLGEFDLIISIGTLQSSNLEFNKLLMSIVQNQLSKDGAMILGFPNCRWVDGEMVYGARVKNYPFSEMGLVYKDVMFSKKYLQQKKFRVTITGKDYIFLTATSIRKEKTLSQEK